MVTTRRSDYITLGKNPPGPLECSPALRRPQDDEEEAEAEEGKAITLPHLHSTMSSFITRTMLQRGGKTTLAAIMTVG